MSVEQNKAASSRIIEEAWNKGNLAVADELIASNYVVRGFGEGDFNGPDGFKQIVTMYRTAFPDIHVTIEDTIAEGDRLAVRYTLRGTHKGDLMGIAPTGKQVTMTGAVFVRFAGGKQVEALGFADTLVMFQQLGVSPPGQ